MSEIVCLAKKKKKKNWSVTGNGVLLSIRSNVNAQCAGQTYMLA